MVERLLQVHRRRRRIVVVVVGRGQNHSAGRHDRRNGRQQAEQIVLAQIVAGDAVVMIVGSVWMSVVGSQDAHVSDALLLLVLQLLLLRLHVQLIRMQQLVRMLVAQLMRLHISHWLLLCADDVNHVVHRHGGR